MTSSAHAQLTVVTQSNCVQRALGKNGLQTIRATILPKGSGVAPKGCASPSTEPWLEAKELALFF